MTRIPRNLGERPLILDFDASVPPLAADETRLSLAAWQEQIRFGCAMRAWAGLETLLEQAMPDEHGCVFTGSGDFHHLSLFLLGHLARRRALAPDSLDLVVCDNHPDNMRYPFGLHCGSWVAHAAKLPCARRVHVIGITSPDIDWTHAWENCLAPFVRGNLFYWSVGRRASWLGLLGRGGQARDFASADALIEAFLPVLAESPSVYLSMDKDVLSPAVLRTNWDQGVFEPRHLETVIRACSGKLAGADLCGEVSAYAYSGWFKRLLSRLDGQKTPDAATLESWRPAQQSLNLRLLEILRDAGGTAARSS